MGGSFWRRLFNRTLKRNGPLEDFSALELYLDERRAEKLGRPAARKGFDERFAELSAVVACFKDPAAATDAEEALLWSRACEVLNSLVDEGHRPRTIKPALLRYVWKHAPRLATSPNALRVAFDRRLDKYRVNDGRPEAQRDGRELKRGIPTAEPFSQADLDKITWHAVANCGGRVSQAVREFVEEEQLDPQILGYFEGRTWGKSYVPDRLRKAVTPGVRMLAPYHQGPRAADKVVPPLDLIYDGIHSMDIVQADDFTWPVYFYVPDGRGWFRLTRGQCIPVIDFRSSCILGYALHPEEQYNSLVIRTAFTRCFDEHGLCKTLYLERGLWKRSKLIVGRYPSVAELFHSADSPLSGAEVELGLRQFGIEFIHARRARSKFVERVGGLLQDLMERERGYCGRDERKDRPEILTPQMRAVESRKVHPSTHFYSFEEWDARLFEIFRRYNAKRQEGKRLRLVAPDGHRQGQSPDEAFDRHRNPEDPPTKFDPSCRYLLAHHRIDGLEVKQEFGIRFAMRGETYRFCDEQTGARIGQRVTAWFNPEAPEWCTFTDVNRRNAFTVARLPKVNAARTDETFKAATAAVQAHARPARTAYRSLKAKSAKPAQQFRRGVPDRAYLELGQHIERKDAERVEAGRQQDRARRLGQKLGVPAAFCHGDDPETLRALEALDSVFRAGASTPQDPA